MPASGGELLGIAEQEINQLINALPSDLKTIALKVPVIFEFKVKTDWIQDGVESDCLGLFVGPPYAEEGGTSVFVPAQIILFLENIWDMAEADEAEYRKELRRTYLHELGHFLGLAEEDIEQRGLE